MHRTALLRRPPAGRASLRDQSATAHMHIQQLLQVLSKRAANEIMPLIIYVTGMHTGAGAGISHAAAGVARERRGAETGGPAD